LTAGDAARSHFTEHPKKNPHRPKNGKRRKGDCQSLPRRRSQRSENYLSSIGTWVGAYQPKKRKIRRERITRTPGEGTKKKRNKVKIHPHLENWRERGKPEIRRKQNRPLFSKQKSKKLAKGTGGKGFKPVT